MLRGLDSILGVLSPASLSSRICPLPCLSLKEIPHKETNDENLRVVLPTMFARRTVFFLQTLWGEPLVDFHHWFLCEVFPLMKGKAVDIYDWTKKHGSTPREYYPALLAFALTHYILFDDYDLLAAEDEFTTDAVLPAFKKIEAEFGLRPLVVKISKRGEHAADQYWWCYAKGTREIIE